MVNSEPPPTTKAESDKKTSVGVFPDALLIAIVTAGAYWLAFRYEAAYLDYFNIPAHLVEVSLQTTLVVALALTSAALGLFAIVNLVLMFWPSHPALQEKIFRVALLLLFPVWHLLNYGFRPRDWIVYTIFFGLIALFELVWPFLIFRRKGSLRERFIADEIAEAPVRVRGIPGRIFMAFGPVAYALFLVFFFGTFLADTAGTAKGATQRGYFVFPDTPDVAVVRVYRDTIIAVPFNRQTKIVQHQVIIRKIGSDNLILSFETDLGPLETRKPEKPTKPKSSSTAPNHQTEPSPKPP